jgi:DnaJ-class molecular chaperone
MGKRSTNFTGRKPMKARHVLSLMDWVGMSEEEIRTALGQCPDCDGEGRIAAYGCGDQAGGWADTCQECKGTGRQP